jgi:hypothetical protein
VHNWTTEVICDTAKTVTVTGAGAGVTIIDAGAKRRFFTVRGGCQLVLQGLTLRNGKSSPYLSPTSGGAIFINSGATLDASSVEFKGNVAEQKNYAYMRRRRTSTQQYMESVRAVTTVLPRPCRSHTRAPTHATVTPVPPCPLNPPSPPIPPPVGWCGLHLRHRQ